MARRPIDFKFRFNEAGARAVADSFNEVRNGALQVDAAIKTLDGAEADIKVTADVSSLTALKARLQSELDLLNAKIQIDPEIDTNAALRQYRSLERNIRSVTADIEKRTKIHVGTDVDQDGMRKLEGFGRTLAGVFTDASGSIGKLFAAISKNPYVLAGVLTAVAATAGAVLALGAAATGLVSVGLAAWFAAVQNPASKAGRFVGKLTESLREAKDIAISGFGSIAGELLSSLSGIDTSSLGSGLKDWIEENKAGLYEFMRASVEAGAAAVRFAAQFISAFLIAMRPAVALAALMAGLQKIIFGFTLKPVLTVFAQFFEMMSRLPLVGGYFADAAGFANGLIGTVDGVSDSILSSADAYNEFTDVATDGLARVADGALVVQKSAAGAKKSADDLNISYRNLGVSTDNMTKAQADAITEWQKAVTTSATLEEQTTKLNDVFASFIDPAVRYKQAMFDLNQARQDAIDSNDKLVGLTVDEEKALVGLASAHNDARNAAAERGVKDRDLIPLMVEGRKEIIAQARELGLTRKEARKYADGLNFLTKEKWLVKLGLKKPKELEDPAKYIMDAFKPGKGPSGEGNFAGEVAVKVSPEVTANEKQAVQTALKDVAQPRDVSFRPKIDAGALEAVKAQIKTLLLPGYKTIYVTTVTDGSGGGTDSDGDGIPDSADKYPNNPNRQSVIVQVNDGRLADYIGASVNGADAVVQRTFNRRFGVQ